MRRGNEKGGAEVLFRAALYIRLSREDGDREESDSVANQRALLGEFAEREESIGASEFFIDDGYSGTDFDRPAFRRMLAALRDGSLNCVVVKDLSRFGRNYIDAGRFLEQEFPLLGVRFISLGDGIDSWARPQQSDTILVPFKNLINDEYSRDISQKIRQALDTKRRRGEFIGSRAPYGYRRSAGDRTRLEIDPASAGVVRRIFRDFLAGRGKTAIARALNAEGVPSPAARRGGAGLWSYSSVDHILRNPVYRGDLVQGRYGNISYKLQKTRRRPEERWFVARGTHEPAVDPADFDRAQALMESGVRAPSPGGTVRPLAGLVRCAECGRALTVRRVRHSYGVYEYYLCPTYKLSRSACTPHALRVDAVERAVLEAIRDEIRAAVDLSRMKEELRREKRGKSRLPALERALPQLMERKRGLYEDWKSGELTKDEYLAFKEGYDRQEAALRAEIAEEKRARQDGELGWEKLASLAYPERLERGLAAALLTGVSVHADGTLTIGFRFRREA